jgi:predicted PurR-regulated permease PerM
MIINILILSIMINMILGYFLWNDTKYYKGVIKNLQNKYKKVLDENYTKSIT